MLDKLLIYRKLSRNQVKLIAMISMLIDHCGKAFCVPDSALYVIMRYAIGRMAFPLFLMLFIDGFYRTKRPWRHVIDLVIFSLLSEPGFDRVMAGQWFSFDRQSVMLTWLVCFLLMLGLHYLEQEYNKGLLDQGLFVFSEMALIFVACIACGYGNTDYTWAGPLAAGLGFMFYQYRKSLLLSGVIMCICISASYLQPWVFMALPVMILYDPDKVCKRNAILKYAGYAFYPVHLTVLALILEVIKTIPPV